MRVIEPSAFRHRNVSKPKLPLFRYLGLFLLTSAALAGAYLYYSDRQSPQTANQSSQTQLPNGQEEPRSLQASTQGTLKQFTNEEFRNLYETFAYPNTREIIEKLPITNNSAADDRIRSIAASRGYRLRSIPLAPLLTVDGYQIQEKALQPWKDLKSSAAKDGVRLQLSSVFRAPEEQQEIFKSRLTASTSDIAAGKADKEVNQTLATTAPPGYSRHHTGYTIDMICANSPTASFETTTCYRWLSKNNYENAKKHGWIPSYPDTTAQGPEPEAWEYIWVGLAVLTE